MIFRKLSVKNFCQHTFAEMELQRGITGIIGKNGKGKSNFSQVGLLYALTGLTVGTTTKKDLIKWGTSNFQTTLTFNKNNIEYILKRSSNSATISWVEDGESKVIKGVTGVDEYLSNLLGMSMQVIKETCFASQGTLLDIISMTHMKRLEYFQKVCGTRLAEVLRGVLQACINDIPNYIDRTDMIKELQEGIVEKEKSFTLSSSNYNIIKDTVMTSQPVIEGYQKELRKPAKSTFDSKVLEFDKNLKIKTKELKTETVEYPKELPLITVDRIGNRKTYYSKLKYEEQLKIAITELNDFLKTEKPNPDKDAYEEALAIRRECDDICKDLRQHYDLVLKGECPTCGQKFTQDPNELKVNLDEAQKIYESSIYECQNVTNKYNDDTRKLKAYEQKFNMLTYGVNNLEANLNTEEMVNVSHDEEQYQKDLISDNKLEELRKKAIESKKVREALEKEIQTIQFNKETYIAGGFIADKNISMYTEEINKYSEDMEEMKKYDIEKQVLMKELEIKHKNIEMYKQEQEDSEKAKEDIKLLENCRDILHREYLPKMVMKRIVGRLNRHMLRYLEKFNTTFTGYLTEDFDFFVDYVSGNSEKPAKSLSGGQKVALAIAFRFALADLLGVAVPLLVLDEPTVHLDDDNVECVATVLETAKQKVATGMHMVIATHQPLLMRGFSHIVDIN